MAYISFLNTDEADAPADVKKPKNPCPHQEIGYEQSTWMKTLGTIYLGPLMMGVGIAVFGLTRLWHGGFGILKGGIAVVAVLVVGVIIGGLLNFAVFAPVYWLLGRGRSKKIETERKHDPEA